MRCRPILALVLALTTHAAVVLSAAEGDGAEVDLPITTAVDLRVQRDDRETGRDPNGLVWERQTFARVDFNGTIRLTNHRPQAVRVEVVRSVLGNATEAGADGTIDRLAHIDDLSGEITTPWRTWWSLPNWWPRLNGFSRITWRTEIGPGQQVELPCSWHYLWR